MNVFIKPPLYEMNRSWCYTYSLIWLVFMGTIAGQYTDDDHNEPIPELRGEHVVDDGYVPFSDLEGRGLHAPDVSSNSFEEDGRHRDRGLFAAFEGSSKHGKYRSGGMFYGGRTPPIFGDYGLGGPQYGDYRRRPFNVGYNNGNRNRFPTGYGGQFAAGYNGNRDRYPGRGFYRQPYPSPY